MFKKRLNVAASRAQDQPRVVHSMDRQAHLSPTDLRRRDHTRVLFSSNVKGSGVLGFLGGLKMPKRLLVCVLRTPSHRRRRENHGKQPYPGASCASLRPHGEEPAAAWKSGGDPLAGYPGRIVI